MAIHKAKRPRLKKQSAVSTQHSVKSKSKPKAKKRPQRKPSPAEFALHERTLPHRRFIGFPLVKGKTAEKVELFSTTNSHSLTIDFQDQTSLHLDIEPGFTLNAQFMQMQKGELETLAEWPPIHISAEEP